MHRQKTARRIAKMRICVPVRLAFPRPLPGVHYYQRDKNDEPTGWMVEGNAFWPLVPLFGIGSEEDFRAAYETLLPNLSAMGITTVFDAGIPGDALLHNALQALAGMERDGKLPLRYRGSGTKHSTKTTRLRFSINRRSTPPKSPTTEPLRAKPPPFCSPENRFPRFCRRSSKRTWTPTSTPCLLPEMTCAA